jgi:hypothetical protein
MILVVVLIPQHSVLDHLSDLARRLLPLCVHDPKSRLDHQVRFTADTSDGERSSLVKSEPLASVFSADGGGRLPKQLLAVGMEASAVPNKSD